VQRAIVITLSVVIGLVVLVWLGYWLFFELAGNSFEY
jgi:hypothetical protein